MPPVAATKSLQAKQPIRTLADLVKRLGGIPLDRIRFDPIPGTATILDVVRYNEKKHGPLCELVDGTLVEKAMGYEESSLAMFLGRALLDFVHPRNLGIVTGEAGMLEILNAEVRVPDVAFISWNRFPSRRRSKKPAPRVAPNLAVEILSRSNTRSEMKRKRGEYFAAGVELVWEIDPTKRTVRVYTAANESVLLTEEDELDGGTVLPGFVLSLSDLFGELDRHG